MGSRKENASAMFTRKIFGFLLRRSRADADLDEELRAHLAIERQRRIDAGEQPDLANAAAQKDLGNILLVKEDTRATWRWSWLERTGQNLRYGSRMLARNPGFAAAAILSLGLGIGANTAIFSVVSGVLLRPLPFERPEELVQLFEMEKPGERPGPVRREAFREWRANNTSLAGAAIYGVSSLTLQSTGDPERVAALYAERNLFSLLGSGALVGRTFTTDDPDNVIVASYDWWQGRLGGDTAAIGRPVTLDGKTYTLIGVMPEQFQFPYGSAAANVWIPELWIPELATSRGGRLDAILARRKPGIPIEDVQRDLTRSAGTLSPGMEARAIPLMEIIGAPVRKSLLVLLGAVGMLLLIACANVANLLLAQTASRAREIAIREALGATRLQQASQFLAEGILLSLASSLVGLALGVWGAQVLTALAATQIPRAAEIGLDWRVFLFLLLICLTTTIAFAVLPVTTGSPRAGDLKTRAVRARLRDVLVVAEIAVAFILLVGAGLLLRTFLNLQRTDPGLDAGNLLTAHVIVSGAREAIDIEESVSAIPGVRAAGVISLLPLQNSGWTAGLTIPGRPGVFQTELRYVTPGYFRAMGIPLRRGRGFLPGDTGESQRVILVNETLARQYFPNEDPVGRVTNRGTIVGMVGDVRQNSLGKPAVPELYYLVTQNFAQMRQHGSTLVVSGRLPADSLVVAVRTAVRAVSPGKALFRMASMNQVIEQSLGKEKLYAWLLMLFAGVGTVLTIGGIYGVVSYLVALKTLEFGIRMALGADKRRVLYSVVGRGALMATLGVVLGIAGSVALTNVLSGFLYGVSPVDPATFASVAGILIIVAILACFLPARRATNVDPAVALRAE
jgi:putative ABC transport system permease protein